ncbi:MAG TPA: Holliday junction resolvase RuvX [Euzebyales bacterium]|nr:Holliday junction resolvase RuvX [Euzebyales bacterium]
MRALGVDLGTVRIGLALSDPGKVIASPHDTLPAGDVDAEDWPRQIAAAIAQVARSNEVDTIVVGLPRSLAGRETAGASAARRVAAALREIADVTVELWDERLSSVEAERMLIGAGQRRAARRTARDRVAAAIILQAWLQDRGRRSANDSVADPASTRHPVERLRGTED